MRPSWLALLPPVLFQHLYSIDLAFIYARNIHRAQPLRLHHTCEPTLHLVINLEKRGSSSNGTS